MKENEYANYPWDKLLRSCKYFHDRIYVRGNVIYDKLKLSNLHELIELFPENSEAIVLQEALAIKHELNGDYNLAVFYRAKEIA